MGKWGRGAFEPSGKESGHSLWLVRPRLTSRAQGMGAGITGAGGAEGIGETDWHTAEQQGSRSSKGKL